MLKPPHTRYEHLYIYYLDSLKLPSIDHPDLIGIWIEDGNPILFFHSPQDELVREICREAAAQVMYQADLDYRDWEAGVTIGPFLTRTLAIRPVWDACGSDGTDRQEIVLDPSVIFGSGFHPTTRMCLDALELAMLESGRKIRAVADLGTGTGLLAVAAAKLGAEKVLAVDNNPLACEVASNNAVMNDCKGRVDVRQIDLVEELPDLAGYDLVIANLYTNLLVRLFSNARFWKTGMYLVSGIIPAMEKDLLAALPPKGVRFLHRESGGIWRLWLLEGNMMAETA